MEQSQLQEIRRKILKQVLDQPELLVEFKELKEAISKLNNSFPGTETMQFLRDVLFGIQSKELKYTSDKELNSKIDEMVKTIKELQIPRPEIAVNTPKEIKISNSKDIASYIKIPATPKEIKISNLNEIKQEFPKKIEVSNLKELAIKDETPVDVIMKLTDNNLWREIDINYENSSVNIKIERNNRDVIKRLIFT